MRWWVNHSNNSPRLEFYLYCNCRSQHSTNSRCSCHSCRNQSCQQWHLCQPCQSFKLYIFATLQKSFFVNSVWTSSSLCSRIEVLLPAMVGAQDFVVSTQPFSSCSPILKYLKKRSGQELDSKPFSWKSSLLSPPPTLWTDNLIGRILSFSPLSYPSEKPSENISKENIGSSWKGSEGIESTRKT